MAHFHLRGTNGHTQCGLTITAAMLVLGLGGFRNAEAISGNPDRKPWVKKQSGPCMKCREKSFRLKEVEPPTNQLELKPAA